MTVVLAADAAFRAVLAIDGAHGMATIQDEVRHFAGALGYDRFVLFSTSPAQEEAVDRIYWIEGAWLGAGVAVDADTYVRRCPMTHHVLEAREPFFWTKTEEVDGGMYRVVQAPRGSGLHGLQVPVFGPLGLEGAVSLGGMHIDASPRARLALKQVGEAAFHAARRLLEAPDGPVAGALTDREREVLAWTAAGRRQVEIAAILGLSERTIENHLRRIRKRLGVATTAQAVRVAIRNGDIAV